MPLSRYRVPKIAQHAALGHTNDCDLENQSCGRDRSSCRRSTTVLTGSGLSAPSLLNTLCRSMRRWTLNGYLAHIRSTSLTRSDFGISLREISPGDEVAET